LHQDKYFQDQDGAEDFARDRAADTLNIKRVKSEADLNLYKNKITAYLDDNLSYSQKKDVESKLGESRELFAFYEEKKLWLDTVDKMIPEATASQLTLEEIQLELIEVADQIFIDDKSNSLFTKITSLFSRKQ
jgi:hypothetical protein